MIDTDDIKDLLKDFSVKSFEKTTGEIDNIIKQRLVKNGFDPENLEYLKNNFRFIHKCGDEFKHLFHISDGKYIISISDQPKFTFNTNNEDLANNNVSVTMEYKYY